MSASDLRPGAPVVGATLPRWRRREVAASAAVAVTSAFIAWQAWALPHDFAARLMHTAVAFGGLSAARAPRLLFLPSALRDARSGGLVVPLSALRLAQFGQYLLIAAAGAWLGSQLL